MNIKRLIAACVYCLLLSACVNIIVETPTQAIPSPQVHNQTIEPPMLPTIAPPADFKPYQLPGSTLGVYIPPEWVVSTEIPGEYAILQSYPLDKYIGGEARQPGDTKCDLRLYPQDVSFDQAVQDIKTSPNSTIISEQQVLLNTRQQAIRFEIDSMGQSLLMITQMEGQVVSFVCFGNLEIFDQIALTLTPMR